MAFEIFTSDNPLKGEEMSDTMGRNNRELVLPPNTYAHVLDSTKGKVSAYVGPIKNSLSDTDQLVVWNDMSQRYLPVAAIEDAIQVSALAGEGQYIVLTNPAPSSAVSAHPPKGQPTEAVDLEVGKRVIVPGPITFPLWPGQTAKTIDGHHLRHNQFVLVRVYDAEQARQHWESAVIAPQVQAVTTEPDDAGQTSTGDESGSSDGETEPDVPVLVRVTEEASRLTMGQLIVVPGTDVSFYMPSTGVEVVPDGNDFVRDAVTLETLEYCILLDENGKKRYVRGPAVVFPEPTETFKLNNRSRVFDAIELNEQSGLYIKVIAEYTDDDERTYSSGEELFITGSEMAIYYPRAEHSIISYDGVHKHHAITIPDGEGRYVLNRKTGQVDLVRGPRMFLPDPRHEVVVRRILDTHDVELMYPGNSEAVAVNGRYRELSHNLTSGEHLGSSEMLRASAVADSPSRFNEEDSYGGDTMSRGTTYQPPRTITLDTKYEGAVSIGIWPGYAVLVTDKTGQRRVEVGPKVVLLKYDETTMALELSTGRPKSDRHLLKTGYLRVVNNVVSDIVTVETRDLVELNVELSYRVKFEGTTPAQQQKWFDVENYVQVLTDHCRSRLRNAAKQYGIQEFYTGIIDIIRDTLLGVSSESGGRTGLSFDENGMRVYDVEILDVNIQDPDVAHLLTEAQSKALSGAIQLSMAEEAATREGRLEEIKRQSMVEKQLTALAAAEMAMGALASDLEQRLAGTDADLKVRNERKKLDEVDLQAARKRAEQEIALQKQQNEVALEKLAGETVEQIARIGAVDDKLIAAMQSLADHALLEKIVTAVAPAALAAGLTSMDLLNQVFAGTPLESLTSSLAERPFAQSNGSRQAIDA